MKDSILKTRIFNKNLKNFWWNEDGRIKKARYRILYGGRASSKSHEFATMIIILALRRKIKVLCTRAFQNRIKDSVKALLEHKIDLLGVREAFTVTNTQIIAQNGSTFLFYGLSRNTEEIKSIEGVDICYIEEGQYITEDMYNILAPTIRKDNSEIWISFNPQLRTDFIYTNFVKKHLKRGIVRKINYDENPFLSETMRDEIEEYRDNPNFKHVYLGDVKDDDDLAVISYARLQDCIDVHIKIKDFPLNGSMKIIGHDVGDGGEDPNAYCYREGILLKEIYELQLNRDELDKARNTIFAFAKTKRANKIVYDSIGVGAGMGALYRERVSRAYSPIIERFVASEKPKKPNSYYKIMGSATKIKNSEYFTNLKAQAWINFRDRVNNTSKLIRGNNYEALIKEKDIISFSSEMPLLEKLLIELSTPHLENKEEDKIKIESKEKLKDRGIKSHNLADSVIMAFFELTNSWR